MSDESVGPLLNVAVFCERTLQEKDDVISLIRIIDRVLVGDISQAPPGIQQSSPAQIKSTPEGELVEIGVHLGFFIRFTSLKLEAERELQIVIRNPLNEEVELTRIPMKFVTDKNGYNFRGDLMLRMKHFGQYWMLLFMDGALITRVPLDVVQMGSLPSASKISDAESAPR